MFGFSMPELILILVVALVVFGPGKLPEIGKALGKSLNEFKKATAKETEAVKEEVNSVKAEVNEVKAEVKETVSAVKKESEG